MLSQMTVNVISLAQFCNVIEWVAGTLSMHQAEKETATITFGQYGFQARKIRCRLRKQLSLAGGFGTRITEGKPLPSPSP